MIVYKKVTRMRFIEGETQARAINYKSKSTINIFDSPLNRINFHTTWLPIFQFSTLPHSGSHLLSSIGSCDSPCVAARFRLFPVHKRSHPAFPSKPAMIHPATAGTWKSASWKTADCSFPSSSNSWESQNFDFTKLSFVCAAGVRKKEFHHNKNRPSQEPGKHKQLLHQTKIHNFHKTWRKLSLKLKCFFKQNMGKTRAAMTQDLLIWHMWRMLETNVLFQVIEVTQVIHTDTPFPSSSIRKRSCANQWLQQSYPNLFPQRFCEDRAWLAIFDFARQKLIHHYRGPPRNGRLFPGFARHFESTMLRLQTHVTLRISSDAVTIKESGMFRVNEEGGSSLPNRVQMQTNNSSFSRS